MLTTKVFLLTTLTFYFSNSAYPIVSQTLFTAKWAIMLLLLFIVLFSRNADSNDVKYVPPHHIYLMFTIFFILAGTVTYLNNISENGIAKLIGFGILVFVASRISTHFLYKENRNDYYRVLLTISQIVVYSTVIFYILGLDIGRLGANSGRFSGWVDNPNTLALMFIPLYPALFLASMRNRKLGFGSPRVLLLLMVFVVVLTGTRSVAIGISIASLIILMSQKEGGAKTFLLILFATMVFLLFGLEFHDISSKFQSFQRSDDVLLSGRDEVWGLAVFLIQQNPMLGYGFDTEALLIGKYSEVLTNHQGATFHNSYLSALVHLGYFGVMPLIWVFIVSLISIVKIKSCNDLQIVDIKVISAAIVLSSFAHAIFESWLFSPGNLAMLLFWVAVFNLISVKRI